MAIKISGTEVINDSRALVNITGADGVYSQFHPSMQTVATTLLDFSDPVQYQLMTANRTYTESNKATGRHSLFLLDTSATAYTPTFSSNIKWAEGTEPTWASYRYWMIPMQCVDATIVRASAAGYESISVLTLDGGSGGAHFVFDGSGGPWSTNLAVRFNTDGTVERGKSIGGAIIAWTASGNWITGGAFTASEYDVRFTNWADTGGGASENFDTKPVADDSWISLSSNRTWQKNSTTEDILNWTGDFEVRKNAGAPPATGSSSWSFELENTQ
jgi:hypothetical protein